MLFKLFTIVYFYNIFDTITQQYAIPSNMSVRMKNKKITNFINLFCNNKYLFISIGNFKHILILSTRYQNIKITF